MSSARVAPARSDQVFHVVFGGLASVFLMTLLLHYMIVRPIRRSLTNAMQTVNS